jgi:hypothetical protein
MSGRSRLPSGTPRKASQRHSRRAAAPIAVIEPTWRPGDKVQWQGYIGTYLRETVDGQVEILVGTRTYRVRKVELQSARS